jgi:hypothetical protein
MSPTVPTRLLALATTAALALALVAVAGAAKQPTVKVPKSGQYNGAARGKSIMLVTSGKSIQIVAFDFACAGTQGRTSLTDIKLKKTAKGYKFTIKAHGTISFRDDQPDENGAVDISGRFTRSGKSASGVLRVKSHRCGDIGNVNWKVRR